MIAANTASDWAAVAVTLLLGAVTAYIGLSINQKRRQEVAVTVADHRLNAYAALWSQIPFSPELLRLTKQAPPLEYERRRLFMAMTRWYYGEGHGMLLGSGTRGIYLTVKSNLICEPKKFVPKSLQKDVTKGRCDGGTLYSADYVRGQEIVRQLSLLRSAMRADLEVYGKPWGKDLENKDREFLYACRVPGWRVQRTARERLHWKVDRLTGRTNPKRYLSAGDEPKPATGRARKLGSPTKRPLEPASKPPRRGPSNAE
jgi:hypothetical protein